MEVGSGEMVGRRGWGKEGEERVGVGWVFFFLNKKFVTTLYIRLAYSISRFNSVNVEVRCV